ncbi:MAG: deoxyribose-phosphate aldolase [Ruminococcaceae bacterium]|nr:deoxyribose-phosphate aldolase [Oscillospiraceae bacterium]
MDVNKILSCVDHTLLSQGATFDEIKALCDDAIKYNTATVCIPPSFVKAAKEYVRDELRICTVVGFPNGYNTTQTKCFETSDAVKNGADEIDMVINIGYVKEKQFSKILDEINSVKKSCEGKTLKVIIETCLLTDDEKIELCKVVSNSNADFIKTSTGFSSGGATKHDIELFSKYVYGGLKIKAAGGISSLQDAEDFINLGASRLGTSKVLKIIKDKGEANEHCENTSY